MRNILIDLFKKIKSQVTALLKEKNIKTENKISKYLNELN